MGEYQRGIIVLIILCLILGGIFIFVYYKYQEPLKKENIINLSISAELEGKKIITGFKINGIEGNTTENYELVQIEKGLVFIENVNLENQTFYKQILEMNITENTRIDLKLEEPIEPLIKINEGNPIVLEVYSKNFKDINFCLTWSLNYIFVSSNFTQIEKLKGYENWDKCFKTDLSLSNSNLTIPISFSEYGQPTEKDYINISLITPEFTSIKDKLIKIK